MNCAAVELWSAQTMHHLQREAVHQRVCQLVDGGDALLPAAAAPPRQLDGAHLDGRRQHDRPPAAYMKHLIIE
jgi:hypothetical protein